MPDTEFELLAACCRAAFAQDGFNQNQAMPVNWDRFLRLARRHRVEGFAWQALGEADLQAPPQVVHALAEQASRIARQNLTAAVECRRLLDAFEQWGTPLLFVKGLTLGALAYRQPFLKMSCDIDVLVPPEAIETAGKLLRGAGYRVHLPASGDLETWHRRHKESVWLHETSGQQIDLHTRLSDNPRLISELGVHSPQQVVQVAEGIRLPTLGIEELFAYLCVHGASSAWFRLKWAADLAAFVSACSLYEIGKLYRRSQELGAGSGADQALLLINRLFDTPLPPQVRAGLVESKPTRWLFNAAMTQLTTESEPTERMLGTASIHWTQLLLTPDMRFAMAEARRQAVSAFR